MKQNTLIDKYLPRYTFNEYHETLVHAPIHHVFDVARNFDLSRSKIIRLLFRLRGLPTRRLHLQDFIEDMDFTFLEMNAPYENLIGFWARIKIARVSSFEDFKHNAISPWIKAVWNFQFEEAEIDQTRVSTETRVLCVSRLSQFTFRLYWAMIKPFSGVIRKEMLRLIKAESEAHPIRG